MKDIKLKPRALCKIEGMLVIAEFSKCAPGSHGKCPTCGSTEFRKIHGWIECECGFAILEEAYDSIMEME
jgi:hypothetical protein